MAGRAAGSVSTAARRVVLCGLGPQASFLAAPVARCSGWWEGPLPLPYRGLSPVGMFINPVLGSSGEGPQT